MPWDLSQCAEAVFAHRVLSPHQLASYARCPKQFELQTLKDLRWPQDPSNFELGTAVHALLDAQAKGLPLEALRHHATPEVLAAYDRLSKSRWGQARVLASEWEVMLFLGDACIQARLDRVVQLTGRDVTDPAATFAIVDWKTGTATPQFPEAHWQTRIYFLAIRSVFASLGLPAFRPEAWSLAYVETGRERITHVEGASGEETSLQGQALRETIVTCTANWLDEIEADLSQQLANMTPMQRFDLPARCPDRFCPYEAICGIRIAHR